MALRFLLVIALLCVVSECIQAFVPPTAFLPRMITGGTIETNPLFACRTNAKKEKIKRNRENMRKFTTTVKRGTSKKKLLRKAQSTKARQIEAEFISQCYITVPTVPSENDKK